MPIKRADKKSHNRYRISFRSMIDHKTWYRKQSDIISKLSTEINEEIGKMCRKKIIHKPGSKEYWDNIVSIIPAKLVQGVVSTTKEGWIPGFFKACHSKHYIDS